MNLNENLLYNIENFKNLTFVLKNTYINRLFVLSYNIYNFITLY
jgi:hypothetical protein